LSSRWCRDLFPHIFARAWRVRESLASIKPARDPGPPTATYTEYLPFAYQLHGLPVDWTGRERVTHLPVADDNDHCYLDNDYIDLDDS